MHTQFIELYNTYLEADFLKDFSKEMPISGLVVALKPVPLPPQIGLLGFLGSRSELDEHPSEVAFWTLERITTNGIQRSDGTLRIAFADLCIDMWRFELLYKDHIWHSSIYCD